MGSDVNLTPEIKYYCTPNKLNQAGQTPPIKEPSNDKQVFDNIPQGYDLILVKRNDSTGNTEKMVCTKQPATDFQSQNTFITPAFGDLTMPENLDLLNITAGLPMLNSLNSTPAAPAFAAGTQNTTEPPSGNSIYDIILQKSIQDYMAGKISKEELIKTQEEIESLAEKDAVTSETKETEIKDKKLSSPQKSALSSFLSSGDNKTFTRDDFAKDEKIAGAQTATQNIEELGVVRTVKVLADGTRIEITEDKGKQDFAGAFKGQRGGFGTGLVGAVESIGGAILSTTGFGAILGVPMMADGARRMYNGATGSAAYTAVITKPDGSQKTIKNNYSNELYNQLYKELGIVK